jgi:small subunit ribosomal protein S16
VATRIRLRRTGKKKQAYYRFVVADSRSPRDGRFIEILGNYNPHTDPPEITIDEERALYWLKTGAQPSNTARSLLSKKGVLKRLAEERPDHPLLKKPVRRGRRPEAAPEEPEVVEAAEAPVESEETAVEEAVAAETAEVVEETAGAEAVETADSGESDEAVESADEETATAEETTEEESKE